MPSLDKLPQTWNRLMPMALSQAGEALGSLVDRPITIALVQTVDMPWPNLGLWPTLPPENTRVALIYLGASGMFYADLLLIFSEPATTGLISRLLHQPVAFPLDDLGESVLGEIGNVVSTAFLNVFADWFQAVWEPTSPTIRVAPLATILPDTLTSIRPGERVYLTKARIAINKDAAAGYFIIIPHF